MPNDINDVVYVPLDEHGAWQLVSQKTTKFMNKVF